MKSPDFQAGVRHGHEMAINQCVRAAKKHLAESTAHRFEVIICRLKVPDIVGMVPNRRGRPKNSDANDPGDVKAPAVSDHYSGDADFEGDDERPTPKNRGRPRKETSGVQKTDKSTAIAMDENHEQIPDRHRRSAPQYTSVTSDKDDDNTATAVKKLAGKRGRGRPRRDSVEPESDFEASNITKKSLRGRNRVLDSDDKSAPHHHVVSRALPRSGITTSEGGEPRQKRSRLQRAVPVANYAEVPDDADFEAATIVSDTKVAATTTAVTDRSHLFKSDQQHFGSGIKPEATMGILNKPARKRGRPPKAIWQNAHAFAGVDTAGAASRMQAKVAVPQKQLQRAPSYSAPLIGQEKSGPSTEYPRGFGPDGTIVSDLE